MHRKENLGVSPAREEQYCPRPENVDINFAESDIILQILSHHILEVFCFPNTAMMTPNLAQMPIISLQYKLFTSLVTPVY